MPPDLTRRSILMSGLLFGGALAGVDVVFQTAAARADNAWGSYANGYIPTSALAEIPWSDNGVQLLRSDALVALEDMNAEFVGSFGYNIPINSAYRDYQGQVEARAYWCAQGNCGNAATPGTSNHGWALAVDIGTPSHQTIAFGSTAYLWLKAQASRYGWVHPSWAEPGGAHPEAWHWEYNETYTPAPVAELFESDEMIRISAPNRGIAIIGAGYFRQLQDNEEVSAAESIVSKTLEGNDRQFDLWKSIAISGSSS
ncbi:MAG: M15 family metallopeptidase [Microbacterium sp.]|uniref:M15 family metallopeptidase n=1 Tax=Microbacterium sp. TaxID=51671 RepID=UPI0039E61C8B